MLTKVLVTVLTLFYPVLIYFGLQNFDPRYLVLILVVVAGLRLFSLDKSPINHWSILVAILILGTYTFVSGSELGLKLYPVFMNVVLLFVFSMSLFAEQSIIERLARLQEPNLPQQAISYTRNVTKIWCAFFCINGTIATYTAMWTSTEIWTLYNGLIAYIAMGVLFSSEWLFRQRIKRTHHESSL